MELISKIALIFHIVAGFAALINGYIYKHFPILAFPLFLSSSDARKAVNLCQLHQRK
jgi:hypothetical protein